MKPINWIMLAAYLHRVAARRIKSYARERGDGVALHKRYIIHMMNRAHHII